MRLIVRSIAVALALSAAACQSQGPVTAPQRTVADMAPKLTRALTPALAEQAFGKPDERMGSGLIIYVYRAEGGKVVQLGFPGFAPILYARVQAPDGTSESLTIRD